MQFSVLFVLLHVLAVASWYHSACASYSYQLYVVMILPQTTYKLPEHCLRGLTGKHLFDLLEHHLSTAKALPHVSNWIKALLLQIRACDVILAEAAQFA